ncbi:hypothetical protein PAAM106076_18465 [Paracoccus aminovorans]
MPRPGMLEADPLQHREADVELSPHDRHQPRQVAGAGPHPGPVIAALPDHDAVAALRGADAAHGGAHRIGRRRAPAFLAAKRADRLGRQFLGHAGVQHDVHQPPALEAEAFQMAVVGQDQPLRQDLALRGRDPPALRAAFEAQHRRVLVDPHAGALQPGRQPLHIARRLDHRRARGIEPALVMVRAGDLLHLPGVVELVRLAHPAQVRGIADVAGDPGGRGGGVDLARALEPAARDVVFLDRRVGEVDGMAVQPRQLPVVAVARAGIVRRGQLVRQVDHEARVAPGAAFRDPRGVQDRDVQPRVDLLQAPRGGQPREARADDGDVAARGALQPRAGRGRGQDRAPPGRAVEDRGADRVMPGHQSPAAWSVRSIQMVLSCVYWSWAWIELSRPPKPDCL